MLKQDEQSGDNVRVSPHVARDGREPAQVAQRLLNRGTGAGEGKQLSTAHGAQDEASKALGTRSTGTTTATRQAWWNAPSTGEEGDTDRGTYRAVPHPELPGQYVVENFISQDEEATILSFLDSDEGCAHAWKLGHFNGPARRKMWGVRTDLKKRTFAEPEYTMPQVLLPVIRRMRTVSGTNVMASFYPNEANAIDYRRHHGHYLGSHCDDRHLSGPVLLNLCLAGNAVMVYTRDSKQQRSDGRAAQLAEHYEVKLPRRALQVQSGTVRYDYQHGIPNRCLLDDRRVSITFRQNKHNQHKV